MDEIVFLLGAGASYDAKLPLAAQVTDQILALFDTDRSPDGIRLCRMLRYVIERAPSPDIETVVSTVEMLQDRHSFELAPFVGEWDRDLHDLAVDAADHTELTDLKVKAEAEFAKTGDRSLREWVTVVTQMIENGELESARFNELLQRLYRSLLEVLELPAGVDLGYLSPLVDLGAEPDGVTVATLNYDLTIENAAREHGVSVSTGLARWESEGVLNFPPEGVRLIKLHGSLDWIRDSSVPTNGIPGVAGTRLDLRRAQPGDIPFLVFGRREKLRVPGPFLDLRAEFGCRLRSAVSLVVVGYSFADDHVNELIRRWANGDQQRIIVVVDPGFPRILTAATGFTQLLYGGLSKPPSLGPNQPGSRLWVLRTEAATALPTVAFASAEALAEAVQRAVLPAS